MTIEKISKGSVLTFKIDGRIDAVTAQQLETELKGSLVDVEGIIFDFEGVKYISSAGLRVILSVLHRQNSVKIIHVNDVVMEVFEITGFTDILTIEQ
jgi:anti-sigma B factor antagonist